MYIFFLASLITLNDLYIYVLVNHWEWSRKSTKN